MISIGELIDQLEKAAGPDRWLDARLDAAFRVGAEKMRNGSYQWAWDNFPVWAPHKQRRGACGLQHTEGELGMIWDSLEFTASVDAAIALCERVLPGRGRSMSKGRTRPDEPLYGCQIYASDYAPGEDDLVVLSEAEHEVEAICLCIAILKAIPEPKP